MKTSVRNFSISVLLTFAPFSRASDVDNFLAAKGQAFRQTNASAPVQISSDEPFRVVTSVSPGVPGAVTGATLLLPNNQLVTLEDEGNGAFHSEASFTTKSQLDAQVGPGLYKFTIFTANDGTNHAALTLPADMYPSTPHVANWLDSQDVDSALPFTLRWDPFTNGTANDYIVFSLADGGDNDIFSTPFLLESNALTGTNTSALIPANTLAPSQSYNARVLFVKRTGINTTNIPGATGLSGYYKETTLLLNTLPSPPDAGRIEFMARNFSAAETDPVAEVTVTRSGSQGTVTVEFTTSNGSATDGADYEGVATTLTFNDGETVTNIAIPLHEDFLLEGNETVNLTLSSPTGGAELGSRSNATLNILDNEVRAAGILQFSLVKVSVAESAPAVNVNIARIGGTAGTVSVNFHTVGGTAISDVDFVSTNGTVTFGPGIASKIIPIRILSDTLDETNETFSVVLDSTTGGAALGSNTTATVTITDDDTAGMLAFSAATYATNENATVALITVLRTGGLASGVTVDFTTLDGVTNPATAGVDYITNSGTLTFGSNELKKVFTVALINDFEIETNETVRLLLSNPTGGARLGAISNATLRILDDESTLSFTNANYTVTEAGLKLNINVVRTGARLTPVTVDFNTTDGTAGSTNDYRGTNGTLTFLPNVAFKTISIPIANDTIVDGNETFMVSLSNPQGGALLGSLTNTTVTILDNDKGGVISFGLTNYVATELGKNASILLKRTGGLASGVTVDFITTEGSATEGLDYSNATQTVTFKAGEISKIILVPILNDALDETNETVLLSLTNATGGASLGLSHATLSITDDDVGGTIVLSAASYATNENSEAFIITVKRSGGVASGVSVDFATQDGVALAGQDYIATNGTLYFASNELTKVISVSITNDLLAEGNETFSFRLTNATGGAVIGAISNATLTIRDDESSISFTNAAYTVSETGPSVSITAVRSGSLNTAVSVQFTTVNGSAISPNDYRGTNLTLNFAVNVSQQTVIIPIVSDTLDENNETFNAVLSNPLGGVQLGTVTNTVVTITDDDTGGIVQFGAATFSVSEGTANASITITRTGGLASGVTLQFTTAAAGNTATVGSDYTAVTTNLTFNVGETIKTVLIPIVADSLSEPTETVNLILSAPTGGAILGTQTTAILNIADKPDPNAIPLNGPLFITGTINGAAYTSLTNSALAADNPGGLFQVSANWTTGSGLSTVLHLMTVDVFPQQIGSFNLDNNSGNHGFATYTSTPFSGAAGARTWGVADGSITDGSSGTFTFDAIDHTAKLATGRFTLHMRETTGDIAGTFINVTGSFRIHLQ